MLELGEAPHAILTDPEGSVLVAAIEAEHATVAEVAILTEPEGPVLLAAYTLRRSCSEVLRSSPTPKGWVLVIPSGANLLLIFGCDPHRP